MWPVAATVEADRYLPTVDMSGTYHPECVTILDLDDWEAIDVKPISPMHVNVLIAQSKVIGSTPDTGINLPAASDCLHKNIVLKSDGHALPLLGLACRNAFGKLPFSYLRLLSDHLGAEGDYHSVAAILISLTKHIIRKWSNELLVAILRQRKLNLEAAVEDIDSLVFMEEVLDCLDDDSKKGLLNEIKVAKQKKEEFETFKQEYKTHKAYVKLLWRRKKSRRWERLGNGGTFWAAQKIILKNLGGILFL